MNQNNNDVPAGYPADCAPHLSDAQANRITHKEHQAELAEFVASLNVGGAVSTDKAAFLLEHMIKESMSADSTSIADQMRADQWDRDLGDGETVERVAERVSLFLATEDGIRLFNFFVKVLARTNDEIYD